MNTYAETYGTTLHYGAAAALPAAITTALAGIKAIGGLPTEVVDEFETTRIDQSTKFKEFAPGMIDSGELQLTLGMKKADFATLKGMVGDMHSWKITYSDDSTDHFDGFIKSLGKEAASGDEVTITVTVRVSGAVTFTPAT